MDKGIYSQQHYSLSNMWQMLEACADWAWQSDADGQVTYISSAIFEISGYQSAQYLGKHIADIPGQGGMTARQVVELKKYFRNGDSFRNIHLELIHPDGRVLFIAINGFPLLSDDGSIAGFRGIGMEVTEKVAADYILERIKTTVRDKVGGSYFETLMQSIASTLKVDYAFVARIDHENLEQVSTVSVYANDQVADNFSYDLQGTPCYNVSTSSTCVYSQAVQEQFPADVLLQDMSIEGYAGTPLYGSQDQCIGLIVVMSRTPLLQVSLVTKVIEMFADRVAAELGRVISEEKLVHQAYSDVLTGLPNRPLAMDRLTHAVKAAKRASRTLSVLFIDLDGFKNVNDSLGHHMGDQLLIEVAERFAKTVRTGETLARLGGDEFLVILDESGEGSSKQTARRLLDCLRSPVELGGREFGVTASIGITIFPDDGERADILMRNADTAMYQAKNLGRNQYQYFTSEMNQKIRERLDMEDRLWHALENDEFFLAYQPIVEIATGTIIGAEALVRWINKDLGYLSPDSFIPLAEEIGVIIPLGEWIIRRACQDSAAFRKDLSPDFTIAVNLSPRQFHNKHILDVIDQALNEYQLDRDAIEIEVTENLLMQDIDLAQEILEDVRERGTRISIDDFGTGYSSLGYLQNFPFTTLKIDRTFVSEMDSRSGDETLVSTIIDMAHNLGLKVIAEGVESPVQLTMLQRFNCDYAQGYYFSEPVRSLEFRKLFYSGVRV